MILTVKSHSFGCKDLEMAAEMDSYATPHSE